ncbi:MAG: hypothetical protein MUO72_08585 [Bacteroidales bacterium]|nr:hypothetical protein [Bacteroidales bacterium]
MKTKDLLENLIKKILQVDSKDVKILAAYIADQAQSFAICEETEDYDILDQSYGRNQQR